MYTNINISDNNIKMEDPGSASKRKRPTYLPDFMNSDSDSEREAKPTKNKKKVENKVN